MTHKWAFCIILSTIFTFIVERIWENTNFCLKMAWPPATHDVISRNHSNWPSPKFVSKFVRGIHEQLLKTSGADVLSSRKKFPKTSEGGDNHPPPPPTPFYVRELRTKKTIGDCAFMIAAPMLWHSMPLSIRPAATIDTLKRSLKTCLFNIINLLSFACFIIIFIIIIIIIIIIITFNRTFILL